MRRLAVLALCASLAIPVAVASPASLLMPSPLTILLTVGQWIKKDRVEVFYVQVQAHGRDEADARDQAFRLAVNEAVGSLLLSQTQVIDGDVKRHEIINYSSGHIQDFKILDRMYSNGVTVKMDVWVSRSTIADRLLSESRAAGRVEGGRIAEQIRSFNQERQGADSVIDAVLKDFPRRAFDVTLGKTSVVVDNDRRPLLRIPFRVNWNDRFVTALSEAIKTVNQHPDCGGWFDNCINRRLFVVNAGKGVGYFNDNVIEQKIFRTMYKSLVRLQILGLDGRVRFSECAEVSELNQGSSPWYFVDLGGGRVVVNSARHKDYTYFVDLSRLPADQLDRVEISIERPQDCSP